MKKRSECLLLKEVRHLSVVIEWSKHRMTFICKKCCAELSTSEEMVKHDCDRPEIETPYFNEHEKAIRKQLIR
jgi:hypothetical protein